MKRITKNEMWLFAIGQLGWAILSGIITNWLVYFYQPDEISKAAGQSLFIPQGTIVLGVMTVIGIITAFGRVFDAITDPIIASISDRCTSKEGRRIPFMKYVSVPFAIMTVLVFISPVNKVSGLNIVALFITLLLFYLCLTIYCTPYNALIAELATIQEDRINISTFISLTFLVGTAIAYTAPMIWGVFEPSLGRVNAMRVTFAGMAVIAFICMLVPTFAIKEKDYIDVKPINDNAWESLIKTFKNNSFKVFIASDIFYWIGLTIFQTGLPFYITSLLGLKESMATVLFIGMTVLSLMFYLPVNILTRKLGKKSMIIVAFIIFAVAYTFTGLTGKILPMPAVAQAIIMITLASIPMAILGILPQAVVADIAQADTKVTGENREGMFFAARTFSFKLGQSIAMLLFTAVATIGTNGLGYRISAFIATFFCIMGGLILIKYNEAKIYEIISSKDKVNI